VRIKVIVWLVWFMLGAIFFALGIVILPLGLAKCVYDHHPDWWFYLAPIGPVVFFSILLFLKADKKMDEIIKLQINEYK
jgi:hypothetical protein